MFAGVLNTAAPLEHDVGALTSQTRSPEEPRGPYA